MNKLPLVARLRREQDDLDNEAADRIEALEDALKTFLEPADHHRLDDGTDQIYVWSRDYDKARALISQPGVIK